MLGKLFQFEFPKSIKASLKIKPWDLPTLQVIKKGLRPPVRVNQTLNYAYLLKENPRRRTKDLPTTLKAPGLDWFLPWLPPPLHQNVAPDQGCETLELLCTQHRAFSVGLLIRVLVSQPKARKPPNTSLHLSTRKHGVTQNTVSPRKHGVTQKHGVYKIFMFKISAIGKAPLFLVPMKYFIFS